MKSPTDQDRKDWANTNLVKRTEDKNYVYELNDNGVTYVLERDTPAPKPRKSGVLSLIGVKEHARSEIL